MTSTVTEDACVATPHAQRPARGNLIYVLNGVPFFLSHRLALAKAARDEGYTIHVAAPDSAAAQAVRDHGFEFHPLPLSRKGSNLMEEWGTLRALVKLYRTLRPSLVHHLTIKPVLYGGLAARVTGVPSVVSAVTGMGYVFTARGAKAGMVRGAVKLAYRILLNHSNSRVIFQNPDDQREFISNRLAPRESTILIKGSGVDTELFSPRPENSGTPIVLFAGRLIWDKGVGEFVEAARILKSGGTRARFVIVGESDEGNPETVTNEQLQKWNAEGVVECWGLRKDMPDVFAQSHVVCFPSYYREGIPKVLIEAASCGRPIVTADSPGCREAVRNGNSGLLVTPRHSAAVAEAVDTLLNDAAMRARMGQAGRELALAEFSIQRIIAETLEVYRELRVRAGT